MLVTIRTFPLRRAARALCALPLLAGLAACSLPDPAAEGAVHDPYEQVNRDVHALGMRLDRNVIRPVGLAYTAVLPDGIERNVDNFAENLGVPSTVINQVLQGNPGDATRNALRFGINTTLGFGGLADVAADLGLPHEEADFGQTLAVWGVPQGAYQVLPVFGPSTERDTAGRLVDAVLNPLGGRLSADPVLDASARAVATGARVGSVLGTRGRFADSIDSLLYDSVDPYAAARDAYLQNRAFELEQIGVTAPDSVDPYAGIFDE